MVKKISSLVRPFDDNTVYHVTYDMTDGLIKHHAIIAGTDADGYSVLSEVDRKHDGFLESRWDSVVGPIYNCYSNVKLEAVNDPDNKIFYRTQKWNNRLLKERTPYNFVVNNCEQYVNRCLGRVDWSWQVVWYSIGCYALVRAWL